MITSVSSATEIDATLWNSPPTTEGLVDEGDAVFWQVLHSGTPEERDAEIAERRRIKSNWVKVQRVIDDLGWSCNIIRFVDDNPAPKFTDAAKQLMRRIERHPAANELLHEYYHRYEGACAVLYIFGEDRVLALLDAAFPGNPV